MSKLYPQLKQLSSKLIRQFGQPCTVIISEGGIYDPETGGVVRQYSEEYEAYCLFDNLNYDFPSFTSSGVTKASSAMVERGDVLIYITAEGNPATGAIIEVDETQWKAIACQPINPAGTALLYQVQARKVT